MNSVSPKVSGAAGAAGVSSYIATIVIWLLGLMHLTVPPEIQGALYGLIAALCAGVTGYYMPHSADVAAALAAIPVAPPPPPVVVAPPPPPANP